VDTFTIYRQAGQEACAFSRKKVIA